MAIRKKKTGEKVNFKENIMNYFSVIGDYKKPILFIIILVAILQVLKLLDRFFFKIIIDEGTYFVSDVIGRSEFLEILTYIAFAFLTVTVTKSLIRLFADKMTNNFEGDMILSVKNKFFNHLVGLSHGFHTTHKTGSLISRMNRGTRALERISDFIIYSIAPLIIELLVAIASLAYFDTTIAMVMGATVIAFMTYGFYITNIQQGPQYEANTTEDKEKGKMSDFFTNIDSVKYFGKENFVKSIFLRLTRRTKQKSINFWNYGAYFSAGQTFILGIGTFFLIFFSIRSLLSGNMSMGTIAFIYTVYLGLIGPLFGFIHSVRGFYVALGDMDELFKYRKITNDIKDKKGAKPIKVKKGKIDFEDVSFRYKGKKKAISNYNLKINPNEKVALVGHSGCGKTTLVKLLYRLYDVDSGRILIDGKDIRDIKQESLRGELSIVPQEAILFDDTIYNNILFSRPNATRKEVMKAMKFAQLDRFVKELPKKENTIVGERGVKLSGGEKQRVSIARAILANKKILILDEATSSLDSRTEYEIQNDLEKLMKGRTTIIIAHRLSTIMKADKIVVMEKGKIKQLGNHDELIKQPGIYRELWNLQKGGYIGE